jgi:hypothetical protein
MALGREVIHIYLIIMKKIKQNMLYPIADNNIGPGAYLFKSTLSNSSFSMRGKANDSKEPNIPGPGSYEYFPTITKNGNHFLSKYQKSESVVFNPISSSRFPKNN